MQNLFINLLVDELMAVTLIRRVFRVNYWAGAVSCLRVNVWTFIRGVFWCQLPTPLLLPILANFHHVFLAQKWRKLVPLFTDFFLQL